jgi:putative PIN family toxin of toxin-antitoxin system
MLRVVIDTNVIVSGILSHKGAPVEVLNAWRERRFLLLSSSAIVAEVRTVLQYPRIYKKYHPSDDDIEQAITLLEQDALLVAGDANVAGSVPDDPKDEMFLACALDGQADVVVSGDHYLLDLGVFREIPIITARQFLAQLKQA